MVTLDQALDTAMQLSSEQQEMLIQILQNRKLEARREEIAQTAQLSISEFQSGQLTPQTAEQAIAELRQSLNDLET